MSKPRYNDLVRRVKELEECESVWKKAEEKLEKEKETLDKLIHLNPYAIGVYNRDGYFVTGNKAYNDLFKVPPSRKYNMWKDPVLKEMGVMKELQKLKQGRTMYMPEFWYNTHDIEPEFPDNPIFIKSTGFPIMDEEGQLESVIFVYEDNTEKKKSEGRIQFLGSIAENITDSILVTDTDFNIIYVNKAFEELFGYTLEELKNKTPSILNAELDAVKLQNEICRNVATGKTFLRESLNRRKDGSTFYCEYKVMPLKDEKGTICSYIGIQRDITERKKAEQALRESKERFKELTELLPEIVFEIDIDGNFIFTNLCAFELTGYTQQDIDKGLNAFQMIIAEDRERMQANMLKVINGEKLGYNEYTLRKKDGSLMPVMIKSSPIIRDGKLCGLRGVVVDITDRKNKEKELQNSVERYFSIFNGAQDGIIYSDKKGKILAINRAFSEITGISEEGIVGKHAFELIKKFVTLKDMPSVLKMVKKNLAGRETEPLEINYEDKILEIKAPSLKYEKFGITGIIRDITQQKKSEEAIKEKNIFLQSLINAIPDNIYYKDVQGHFQLVNKAFEKTTGKKEGEMLGKTPKELFPEDTAQKIQLTDEMVIQERKPFRYEQSFPNEHGEELFYDITKVPVFNDKEILTGIILDL